jgi:hypothetical protein
MLPSILMPLVAADESLVMALKDNRLLDLVDAWVIDEVVMCRVVYYSQNDSFYLWVSGC